MSQPQQVQIIQLDVEALDALAGGDLPAADRAAPVPLSEAFVCPEWISTWRRRSRQIREDPPSADWITGVVWDLERHIAVGRAGYHGPPDPAGMVEIGYAIDPAYRRRGYARAALEALLDRARREEAVTVVRATIRPDNVASSSLVLQYGFAEVGSQIDDEDGLETIYEVACT